MLEGIKDRWREFKKSQPGRRFQDRYERNRTERSKRSWLTRFLKPVAAIALILAGVIFCLIPGPGLPLLGLGAALLADISLPVARALDWLELRIRALWERLRRFWNRASIAAKSGVIVVGLLLVTAAGYGMFRLMTDGA
jgi:hypothetical protein